MTDLRALVREVIRQGWATAIDREEYAAGLRNGSGYVRVVVRADSAVPAHALPTGRVTAVLGTVLIVQLDAFPVQPIAMDPKKLHVV